MSATASAMPICIISLGFLAGDRFALLVQEKTTLLVSSMETGRAKKESIADKCLGTSRYQMMEKLKRCKKPEEAYLQVLVEFLRDHGIKRLGVPFRFPVGIYQPLLQDFEVKITGEPCLALARDKEARGAGRHRLHAEGLREGHAPGRPSHRQLQARGEMLYREGQPLTSEKVRGVIEVSLLEDGCEAMDTIVAGGLAGADPHARGTGPIAANAPIVIDIFPRSKSSRYFADMTRTVLKGRSLA